MRNTYSEPKNNLGRSGSGLIASLGLKAKSRPNKYKKARYSIGNFSMKDLSRIIREFRNCVIKVMSGEGPNMILMKVNFT